MIPLCSHTGTPRHFHSSVTSGTACLISERTCASVLPRQSPSSLIRPSISLDGDWSLAAAVFFVVALFILFAPRSADFQFARISRPTWSRLRREKTWQRGRLLDQSANCASSIFAAFSY